MLPLMMVATALCCACGANVKIHEEFMNDLNEKIVLNNDETIAEDIVQDINSALMCVISNYRSIIDGNNITL